MTGFVTNPMTANLNMNSLYKITGLVNGSSSSDSCTYGQLTSYVPSSIQGGTSNNNVVDFTGNQVRLRKGAFNSAMLFDLNGYNHQSYVTEWDFFNTSSVEFQRLYSDRYNLKIPI